MRRISLLLLVLLASSAAAQPLNEKYQTFSDFRHKVLDLIGSAQKQVFLTTDFLTDGETVTALYLAKYRGIQVKVFLGAGKADSYMSRLTYLKNQNILTYLTPAHFPAQKGTVLVIDNAIFLSNNSLDYRTNATSFRLETANEKMTLTLLKAYQDAFVSPIPVKGRPTPLVGRPSRHTPLPSLAKPSQPAAAGSAPSAMQTDAPENFSEDGYNYDKNRAGKSSVGAPKHLPNKTKFQIKQMKQVEEAMQTK